MWNYKDFIGIKNLTNEEIKHILDLSFEMKQQMINDKAGEIKQTRGNMTTLFFENSTRTKHSFYMAGQNIGLRVTDLAIGTSSVQKGESLMDTLQTIDSMGTDIIVMRHSESGSQEFAARNCKASIISAGDGTNEHPTQALLDAMTILDKKGSFEGLKVTIAGDILHSRVAKSNLYLLNKMGAKVTFTGPTTLVPKAIAQMGAKVCYDLKESVKDADVVMGLRIQMERQNSGAFPDLREYNKTYGIDGAIFDYAKKDAILMHPAPVNWGVELDRSLFTAPYSVISEQVTNGVAVRMAILYMIMEYRNNRK
jgi:aspartate carbamoyltransferase catalytic subunit